MRRSGGKVWWNHILCSTSSAKVCGALLWNRANCLFEQNFSLEICIDKCLWGLHKGRSLVTLCSFVSFRTHIGKQIKVKQLKLSHFVWLSYFNWPLHLWWNAEKRNTSALWLPRTTDRFFPRWDFSERPLCCASCFPILHKFFFVYFYPNAWLRKVSSSFEAQLTGTCHVWTFLTNQFQTPGCSSVSIFPSFTLRVSNASTAHAPQSPRACNWEWGQTRANVQLFFSQENRCKL